MFNTWGWLIMWASFKQLIYATWLPKSLTSHTNQLWQFRFCFYSTGHLLMSNRIKHVTKWVSIIRPKVEESTCLLVGVTGIIKSNVATLFELSFRSFTSLAGTWMYRPLFSETSNEPHQKDHCSKNTSVTWNEPSFPPFRLKPVLTHCHRRS